MSKQPATFDEFLRDTLPSIDEHLAARGTAVQDRPLTAARQIVDLFIVEIRGDTKENYLEKTWFAGIFKSISKWYEQRYGDTLRKSRQAKAFGIVTYFGTPYLLRVPLVFTKPGENGTAWINFPCEVLPSEDPLGWIETPPPLDTMKPKRKEALRIAAKRVAYVPQDAQPCGQPGLAHRAAQGRLPWTLGSSVGKRSAAIRVLAAYGGARQGRVGSPLALRPAMTFPCHARWRFRDAAVAA